MVHQPHILVIDSGIGGLGVVTHLKQKIASFDLTYIADQQYFPYGSKSKSQLEQRVEDIVKTVESRCKLDLVIIACNSASTMVLEHLRHVFDMPIVGMVPAIKLAANLTKSKEIGILATKTTVNGLYLEKLIQTFASHCDVYPLVSNNLAFLAEQKLNGNKVLIEDVYKEIQPLFEKTKGLDQVILGCTHYPFLMDELVKAAPYEVNWLDPAERVAAHVQNLLNATELAEGVQILSYYHTSKEEQYQNLQNYEFQSWPI